VGDERKIPREFERELIQTETLVVEMRESAGGHALSGQSRNMSMSGIFVDVAEPPPTGTEVQLFIGSLSSSSALRATAQVIHVEPGVGFGARFLDDTAEAREYVASFLNRFRKR
jgi:hypothetical protein